MAFDRTAFQGLAGLLDTALNKAYATSARCHEKHYVKAMVKKAFLNDVRNAINSCLQPGWVSRVEAAYVDTYPRVKFQMPGVPPVQASIEIGDILFIKHVYPPGAGAATSHIGRAWLIQAKRTPVQRPGSPPMTSKDTQQHYFSEHWPLFSMTLDGVALGFAVPNSTALQWWGVVWSRVRAHASPGKPPWAGNRWIAADTKGQSFTWPHPAPPDYASLGFAMAQFMADDVRVGQDYTRQHWPPPAAPAVQGWDGLITALLQYCKRIKQVPGRIERHVESSSFMTHAMLNDCQEGWRFKQYLQDFRARIRAAQRGDDGGADTPLRDDGASGFLLVRIDILFVGEPRGEYRNRWGWRWRTGPRA